jgi:hypothetical protein
MRIEQKGLRPLLIRDPLDVMTRGFALADENKPL